MEHLQHQGVPSLSVYDSLIVPVSAVRVAAAYLADAFYHFVRVPPVLKTKSPVDGAQDAIDAAMAEGRMWGR
jgi:hypothetical protein